MSNLTQYIESTNAMNRLFKRPLIDANNITEAVAQDLFDRLDCDLSPENLCCDGEISASAARKKAVLFHGAAKELMDMGFRSNQKWSEFA